MNIQYTADDIHREIQFLDRNGYRLALHSWLPRSIEASVFYFHGLQSHAGWVWEAATQFATNNTAVFVLDRRGSGISEGRKDDLQPASDILLDYIDAIEVTKKIVSLNVPLCLFGHCLGGSVLAALLNDARFNHEYNSSIFCSSWLGKLHTVLEVNEREVVSTEDREDLLDVGLNAADFTSNEHYKHYIKSDELAVRMLTLRSRSVLLELEKMYVNSEIPKLRPTAYVSGMIDPIVNLADARRNFLLITGGRGHMFQFPVDKHYLFFTPARTQIVNWASSYARTNGYNQHA